MNNLAEPNTARPMRLWIMGQRNRWIATATQETPESTEYVHVQRSNTLVAGADRRTDYWVQQFNDSEDAKNRNAVMAFAFFVSTFILGALLLF